MLFRNFFTRPAAVSLAVATLILFLSSFVAAEDGADGDAKRESQAANQKAIESAERLANMRRRAEHTHVFATDGDKREEIAMRSEPVFRYGDQPRGIVDATLWVWGEPGRPVALQKIEFYPPTPTSWTYCLASLSSGLVAAEWQGGRTWTAIKPGVEMRLLDGGPDPSANKAGRIRQMKDLARRFTVRGSEATQRREELRLITQPIHRYADAEQGIEEGAIFGFGSGTNPNCLLLIELAREVQSRGRWQYGFVGMSAESLRARFDDHEVWFFPAAARIGGLDTWIWFFEARGMED
jgi:hypothetical protein